MSPQVRKTRVVFLPRLLILSIVFFGFCLFFLLIPNRVITQATETCVQSPPGIIAWWPLDETSGTIAGDIIGNNSGTYVNGPVPVTGNVGGALRFDGTNDYVAAPDSNLWAFGSNDFTIEFWANFDAPGSGTISHPGDIFIGNDEGPFIVNKWFFALGGGRLEFVFSGPAIGDQFLTFDPFAPNTNQWYHLAVVRQGNTFTAFVNGLPSGSVVNTAAIPNPNAPLTIGQAESLGFMNGRLDEVTIYSRALSASEIQGISDAGSAGKCKSGVIQNGPVTSNVVANPNPAGTNVSIALSAIVSDAATGGSNVAAAEYSVNGGAFVSMNPADGAFDQPMEIVTATVPPFSAEGLNSVCVRGTDADGNVGVSECLTLPVSSQTCVQPSSGAISWWPLDETTGMIAADRIGNHPGAYASGPAPAPGKVRGALRFNGSNYVAVEDSDSWAFGTNNFTIELWANFDTPGSGSIGEPGDIFIGTDEGPGNRNKWFFALGGGVLDFTVYNVNSPPSNVFLVRAPFSPVVGQWYHLAVTKSGTLFTIFVNGVPVGSEISTSPIANANAPLTIGQAENIGFMNGRLDEVAIYNRDLPPEELQAIYNAGSAGKCINLSIRPDRGGDTGSVTVHINGSGFAQGATVNLVRAGQTDIVGSPITVGDNGTTIDTALDLTGRAQGAWNVVVTNPDGSAFVLPEGFIIELGRASEVWVDIVGLNVIRAGRTQTFHIFYGNRGNVDALGVPVWIAGLPSSAQLGFTSEISDPPFISEDQAFDRSSVPQYIEVDGQLVVPLIIPRIPPGQTDTISFTVTTPSTVAEFTLRAWANPPLFNSPLSPNFVDCMKDIFGLAGFVLPGVGCVLTAASPIVDLIAGIKRGPVWWTRWVADLIRNCIPGARVSDIVDLIRFSVNAILRGTAPISSCTAAFKELSSSNSTVRSIVSFDPNDKVGAQGIGEVRYLSGEEPLPYAVLFENLETASAPAQEVVITDQLDTVNMDLSTLSFGPIAFGSKQVIPTLGASAFATDVDLRPDKNLIVRITASLNPNTGLVTWRFTSIDPTTGNPPEDPLSGFLPPDINPPQGDGSVLFTVMPKKGLATGTEIRNKARIIFDVNEPIDTPEWLNTIDNSKPSSNVLPLTASQCESNVQVQWAGTDEGSGIANYMIFVSDNGTPFTIWQQNTATTSGIYTGQFGHTYAFYSVAQDMTGNLEDVPASPDATVTLSTPAPPLFTSVPSAVTVYTGLGATSCAVFVSDSSLGIANAQSPCSAVSITRSGVPNGNIFPVGQTTITYTATDASGNTATATQTVTVLDNTPPVITSESVSPASLWPSNHTLRDVSVNYTAIDNCSSNCTLSVMSNEPVNGTGDGDTEPDWTIVDAHHVRLRAERAANGNGRAYAIRITCTDGSGNSTSKEVTVFVAHNITGPTSGAAFKIGTAVNFAGTFWDVSGKTHTAQWTFDDAPSTTSKVVEPSGSKPGTVTGTYTFTTLGVYKIKMKVTDNTGQTSWVDTAGDVEAIVVIYDPNGGYTIGGGYISALAGSNPADPSKTGKLSFGFNSKYTNATNPKGETQIQFAVGGLEFNALNYDYLVISGARAQFRGFGKVNGESGYNFILTVIDGQLKGGGGVDKFRIKIWNKTTGALVFDSQMGASDAVDPSTPVGTGSSIVIQK